MNPRAPAACDCPVDECSAGLAQTACVSFHARTAELDIEWCDQCAGPTWHADSTCLKIIVDEDQ